ncbi:winged helix-turn-helix domain-containing protein [Enterococcus sp. LJL99]
MHNIGYISMTKDWKQEYFDMFDTTKFTVHQLNDDEIELFSEQQVLLIETSCLEDLPSICQVLIKAKECPGLLIYIISSLEKIDQVTRTVFLQLGANGIKDETMSTEEFSLIITNTLNKISTSKSNGMHLFDTDLVNEDLKFQLNANNLSLFTNRGEIGLTKLEYQIMDLLYRNMGRAVTYTDIYESVWKSNNIDDEEKKSRIANAVFHLRKKMTGDSDCIKTVRSKGYMLSV